MPVMRIVMKYTEDPNEIVVIVGSIDENNKLLRNSELFGSSVEWNEEECQYDRWPFYSEGKSDNYAEFVWGPNAPPFYIDVFDRRLVIGELCERLDNAEGETHRSNYEITSISSLP